MVKPDIKKKHQPKPINTEEEQLREANRVKALISNAAPEDAARFEEACNKVVFYDQKVKELDKEYQEKLATAEKTIDLLMKIKNGYEAVLAMQPIYVGMTKEEFKDSLANFIENHDQMREDSNVFYVDQAMKLDKILKEYFEKDKPKVTAFHENMGKLAPEHIITYIADQQVCKEKLLHDIHDLYHQGKTAENSTLTKEEFKKAIFSQIKLNRGDVNIELEAKYKELQKMMKEQKNIPKERLENVVELLKHLDENITAIDREEAAKKELEKAAGEEKVKEQLIEATGC